MPIDINSNESIILKYLYDVGGVSRLIVYACHADGGG